MTLRREGNSPPELTTEEARRVLRWLFYVRDLQNWNDECKWFIPTNVLLQKIAADTGQSIAEVAEEFKR